MNAALLIVLLGLAGYYLYTNGGFMSFSECWLTQGAAPCYVPYLNQVEVQYGLPTDLLCAVAYQESSFNPSAVNSSSGATGMFQLMPCYYPNAGQSWQDDAATAAGALAGYYQQFNDWTLALAAYNWGPGNVTNYLANPSEGLPTETSNYVAAISSAVPVSGQLTAVV